MSDKKSHKFDEKIDVTYRQYILDTMAGEVSLEKELESVLGKEKAHELIRTWAENRTVASFKDYLKKIQIKIDTFDDFIKHMDEMWASKHVSHTHACTKTNETENSVTYTVTECIWTDIMKKLEATDLGKITMCDLDFVTADLYNPHISLIRKKTLMNGDEHCDFTYVWDE